MGCFGKIFKVIVFIVVVAVIVSIGGVTFFKDKVSDIFKSSPEAVLKKASEVGNFSDMNEEFKIVKTGKIFTKADYVYIKHKNSSQKFLLLKPYKNNILTKNDFKDDKAEEKCINFIKKFENHAIHPDNFRITEKKSLYTMNQKVPYIQFKVDLVNCPVKGAEGIVGSASAHDGKNIIIVAVNSDEKYSGIITDAFLKSIKK